MKNENTFNSKFSLNSILVQDKKTKGFTAFFKQFPNIIVEGDTENEAMANLVLALKDVMDYKSKKAIDSYHPAQNIIEKTVEYQTV